MVLLRTLVLAATAVVVRADYWAFSTWIRDGFANSSAGCTGTPDEVNVQLQGCMRSQSLPHASWALRCLADGSGGALVEYPDSDDCGARNGHLSLATAFNVLDCAVLPAESPSEPSALFAFRKHLCSAISFNTGTNVVVLGGGGETCYERSWGQYRRQCVAGTYAAPLGTVTTDTWDSDSFVGANSCGADGSVIDAQTLGAPSKSLTTPVGGCFIPFDFQGNAATSTCNDVAEKVTYQAYTNISACRANNLAATVSRGFVNALTSVPTNGCEELSGKLYDDDAAPVVTVYSRSTCTVEPYGPPNAQGEVGPWPQFGRNPAHSFTADSAAPLFAPKLKWKVRFAGVVTASPSIATFEGASIVCVGDSSGTAKYINGTNGFPRVTYDLGIPLATTFAIDVPYVWLTSFVVFSMSTRTLTITDSKKHSRKPHRNELSGNWEAPSAIFTADLSTQIQSFGNEVSAFENKLINGSITSFWTTSLPDDIVSTPALCNMRVYVGCNDRHVYALDLVSGDIKWASKELERNVTSSPTYVAADKSVYVSNGNHLYAFHAASGIVRWEYEHEVSTANDPLTEGLFMQSSPVVVGKYVVWANTDGTIVAVQRTNGKFGWRFDEPSCSSSRSMPPQFYATPAVDANGLVIVGATNGVLYAINGVTGRKAWAFDTTPRSIGGGPIFSSATIDADGDIYVGAGKTLLALKRSPPKSPKSPGGKKPSSPKSPEKNFRRSGGRSVAELPAPDNSDQELLGAPSAVAMGGSFLAGAATAAAVVGAVILLGRRKEEV